MTVVRCLSLVALSVVLVSVGMPRVCRAHETDPKKVEAKVKEAFSKLSAADRSLAEAQRYCPIDADDRLGSMGAPVKLMIEGQPVFLCCEDCRKGALAKPKETLAKVEKLKKAGAAIAKLPAADRDLALAQRFCGVESENPLGSMGVPVKVMLNAQPVFLCCKGCTDEAQAHPKETLAKFEKLKKGHAHGEK